MGILVEYGDKSAGDVAKQIVLGEYDNRVSSVRPLLFCCEHA